MGPLPFLPALLAAASQSPPPEWTPLSDGRTLAGWHVAARPEDAGQGLWKAEDGAITCDSRGRPGHDYLWLVSSREFADFELRLQVRSFRGVPGNSGIQVRSRYDGTAWWLDGLQIDVHPPAPWRTGLIYDEALGVQRWIHPSLPDWTIGDAHAPAHRGWRHADEGSGWNGIDILCRGTGIRATVNGHVISNEDFAGLLDDANHRARHAGLRGHIALQLHRKDELCIQFRKIEVRVLVLP